MEQLNYPAFPRLRGDNRKEKRAMIKEFDRLTIKTGRVEAIFADRVFKDTYWDYEELYLAHLEVYIKTLKSMRPKFIVMNSNYFKDMYKSDIVEYTGGSFIHNLHELIRMVFGYVK